MKISVTKSHIQRGRQRSACECPVALAINRVLRGQTVSVSPTHVYLAGQTLELPQIARDFVHRFDLGSCVDVIEFELDAKLPEPEIFVDPLELFFAK